MTRMLATVTDVAEADEAVRLGADIIGLSAAGAMAAVDPALARAVVARVAGRRETRASLGEPPDEGGALAERAHALGAAGVDALELALDGRSLERLAGVLAPLAKQRRLVGVLIADAAPDFDLLAKLAALGFPGAMLDTRAGSAGRLLDHLDIARLDAFCARCRALGLASGLAGALEAPDTPRLLLVEPDVLGFRGALRRGPDRTGRLDPQRFALIRDLIPSERPDGDGSPALDRRPPAGETSGHARDSDVDHIYVRDFVVSASVGGYDFERSAPQRVVFDVEAAVRRSSGPADDLRSIFSYDVILDSIRLAVGRGHVQFVETLAEEVAEAVLRRERVQSVRVSVRKIDVIDGSVGIAIRRARSSAAAASRAPGAARPPHGKD
ncbi:dihydroneopterin aldolase [Roseiarcus fermentans]|uniref:4-(hydroxymethyl)-2-furancarboxaldehyde-phosphate synthase n=1 Tax=Roseiarcus fermentans TaxID=1473586 RepID=A0A366FJC2_9HYPH|nr:(5-formylfuran-3-yl)methyl phosphate synthase [Roseiarcus fermentans]RBP14080.1 dihydroneopterin aldolase [Roseiarcus fermentans]